MSIRIFSQPRIRDHKRERMQSVCLKLIDEGDVDRLIERLQAQKGFNEAQRLWIIWKVSQIQAGRNIIAIAQNGLEIMGIPDAKV